MSHTKGDPVGARPDLIAIRYVRISIMAVVVLVTLSLVADIAAQAASAATVSGVLVGLNEVPLKSARINVGSSSVVTGSDGSFEFTVQPGTYPLEVTAYNTEGKGFAPYYSQFSGAATVTGSVKENLTLPLHPLAVHVEGPSGESVAGTRLGGNNESLSGSIEASLAPGFSVTSGYFYLNQPMGTTDTNGNAVIPVPDTKTPWTGLRVIPPSSTELASTTLAIGGPATTESTTIRLALGATVSGVLVGLNEVPLKSARINVGSSSVVTGSDGSFEFTVQPGTYPLEVTAYNTEGKGFAPYYSQFSGAATVTGSVKENLTLPLHPLAVHVEGPSGESVAGTRLGGNNESLSGSIEASLAPGFSVTSGYFYLNQPMGTTDTNGNAVIPVPDTKTPWTGLRVIPPSSTELASTTLAIGGPATTESTTIRLALAPKPTVTKLSAKKGPASGGISIMITGTNLSEATRVAFGVVVASFEVLSATTIRVVTPPATAGVADVMVTTPGGTSISSKKDQYRSLGPTIARVNPERGPAGGGSTVDVTGSGFALGAEATGFKFGKASGTGVYCASTTECSVVAPAGKHGTTVDVVANVAKYKSKKTGADHFAFE
jgi:hypothetical protein